VGRGGGPIEAGGRGLVEGDTLPEIKKGQLNNMSRGRSTDLHHTDRASETRSAGIVPGLYL